MIRRVARLFKPYRGQVGLVFGSILVTGALGVAPAFLTKAIINDALLPHDLHLLWQLVLLMIAIPLVSGAIGVGQTYLTTVVAFTTLQTRLLFPIGNMLQTSVEVQSSLALFERIFAYLDLPQDIVDAPGARELPKDRVRGRVDFDGVYFRYDEPVQPAALEAQAVEVDGDGP